MKSERNLASENQNHIAEAPAGAESTCPHMWLSPRSMSALCDIAQDS